MIAWISYGIICGNLFRWGGLDRGHLGTSIRGSSFTGFRNSTFRGGRVLCGRVLCGRRERLGLGRFYYAFRSGRG